MSVLGVTWLAGREAGLAGSSKPFTQTWRIGILHRCSIAVVLNIFRPWARKIITFEQGTPPAPTGVDYILFDSVPRINIVKTTALLFNGIDLFNPPTLECANHIRSSSLFPEPQGAKNPSFSLGLHQISAACPPTVERVHVHILLPFFTKSNQITECSCYA